jgi:hypothetical protein
MTHFSVSTLENLALQRDEIVQSVQDSGYTIIRGLFNPNEIRSKLELLKKELREGEIFSSSGTTPDQIKGNFLKWSIGGQSLVQQGLPRFMVTVYNTFFSEDKFGFHSNFETLIQIRDILAHRNVLFDNTLLPKRYNGCRLQVYPSGGGFMGAHIDKRAIDTNEGKNDFIQLLMLVSQKGLDYTSGGAYVVHNDQMIDVEADSLSGDVVIYNGDTLHGVADIDPHLPLDRNQIHGRVVALVTIYANNLTLS